MTSVSGAGASPVGGAHHAGPVERIPVPQNARAFSLLMQRSEVLQELAKDGADRLREQIDRLAKGREILADMRNCKEIEAESMPDEMQHYLLEHDIKVSDGKYLSDSQKKDSDHFRIYNKKGEDITATVVSGAHHDTVVVRDPETGNIVIRDPETGNVGVEVYDEDDKISKEDWDVNIQYMQAKLDSWSTEESVASEELKSLITKQGDATNGANSFVSQEHDLRRSIDSAW